MSGFGSSESSIRRHLSPYLQTQLAGGRGFKRTTDEKQCFGKMVTYRQKTKKKYGDNNSEVKDAVDGQV